MQRVCRKLGFQLHEDVKEGVVKAEIDLEQRATAA